MKKFKFIGIFIILLLSVFSHFIYDFFPNIIFSIFFPVNESIWEHMKLIITPTLIFMLFEYLFYKKKNIKYNNLSLSYIISIILGIIIYLMIYLPIHYTIGHNLIISIIILIIVYLFIELLSYKLIIRKEIKNSKIISIVLIIITYLVFLTLTYFPPKIDLFYDTQKDSYGILKKEN